jgi:energy-coupling factor transport system substrate-specific component
VFVLLEGILFGIHFWWISYLYVWALLVLITQLLRNQESPLFWSMLSAMFGLGFGALCAIPYGITGALNGGLWNGAIAAFSWWVAGIPYDLLHCAGNFVIMLVMYKPMQSAMQRIF